jgi:hypothetical protein
MVALTAVWMTSMSGGPVRNSLLVIGRLEASEEGFVPENQTVRHDEIEHHYPLDACFG